MPSGIGSRRGRSHAPSVDRCLPDSQCPTVLAWHARRHGWTHAPVSSGAAAPLCWDPMTRPPATALRLLPALLLLASCVTAAAQDTPPPDTDTTTDQHPSHATNGSTEQDEDSSKATTSNRLPLKLQYQRPISGASIPFRLPLLCVNMRAELFLIDRRVLNELDYFNCQTLYTLFTADWVVCCMCAMPVPSSRDRAVRHASQTG